MTYRLIASTETDPGAPGTSALFKALDGNATAIAEGAAGAPRANPRGFLINNHSGTGQTVNFIDLVSIGCLHFQTRMLTLTGGTARNAQFRTSSDNGATWGAFITLTALSVGGAEVPTCVEGIIDIQNGISWGISLDPDSTPVARPWRSTFTPVTNANAFSLRSSVALGTFDHLISPMGGNGSW